MTPAARIDIASLLLSLGREREAVEELRAHQADDLHPGHRAYFEEWLRQRDLSLD